MVCFVFSFFDLNFLCWIRLENISYIVGNDDAVGNNSALAASLAELLAI